CGNPSRPKFRAKPRRLPRVRVDRDIADRVVAVIDAAEEIWNDDAKRERLALQVSEVVVGQVGARPILVLIFELYHNNGATTGNLLARHERNDLAIPLVHGRLKRGIRLA